MVSIVPIRQFVQRNDFNLLLLVGQQGELGGCHNDCVHMMRYVQSIGYSADPDDVKILMDDGECSLFIHVHRFVRSH